MQSLIRTSVALVLILVASSSLAADSPGAAAYNTNCSVCHQVAGQGVAGLFPSLAGRVNRIAATEAGRKYLTAIVLNGMSGSISVEGTSMVGVMPGFASLDDTTIAAILVYIQKFEQKTESTRISASDVKAARKDFPLASAAMHALRKASLASDAPQN